MITFRDVSKIYHIGGEEVRALDHASMQIEQGEFVGIIGPSGSGKSTLMNIMGCLDVADEGEYILDGQPIEHRRPQSCFPWCVRSILHRCLWKRFYQIRSTTTMPKRII